jgi:hypothetical protein
MHVETTARELARFLKRDPWIDWSSILEAERLNVGRPGALELTESVMARITPGPSETGEGFLEWLLPAGEAAGETIATAAVAEVVADPPAVDAPMAPAPIANDSGIRWDDATPDQIAARCKRIRAGWTDKELRRRAGKARESRWTVPRGKLAAVGFHDSGNDF